MSDILVKKYQHYFNESVKLQETVNEQAAYIQELEEALIDLDEVYRITKGRREALDEMAMTADYKNKLYKRIKGGDDAAMKNYVRAMHSLKVHGEGGKVVGKVTGKYGDSATDLSGKPMGRVDAEGIVIPKGKKQ